MKPVTRVLAGAGDHIVPLTTYAEPGVSYASDIATVVKPLVNKLIVSSILETKSSATSGSFIYPADALLVTTTGTTTFSVLQYGD